MSCAPSWNRTGYRFFSASDTEVIVKAYDKWGRDCVSHFAGMFAFAIHEHASGRLLLARDRLGVKPMYLAETAGALRFASTLPALLAGGGIDTSIDAVALHHYLSWHAVVPPPRTILNGVQKLPPATTMLVEPDGSGDLQRYWRADFSRQDDHGDWSDTDWSDAVLEALRVAVKRRMVSDVPVGVLLSGGLDSSLIVALLETSGQEKLATFSIGFDDVGAREGNEFKYSDVIAEQFATDHHKIRVDTGRMLPALDGAIAAMSEPMVSHDAVAFYLLSEEVSKSYKVVQSGQGADEVFAGYSWYPPLWGVEGTGADAYQAAFFDRPHAEMAETLNQAYRLSDDPSRAFLERHFEAPGAEDPVDRALRLDTEVMLVDDPVKRVDNMTMAWGLEARTPFLDHELVGAGGRLPAPAEAGLGRQGRAQGCRSQGPAGGRDRPTQGLFPGARALDVGGSNPGADPRDDEQRRRPRAGAVRTRARADAAGGTQRTSDHARGLQAVAAGAAGAVADPPWSLTPHAGSRSTRNGMPRATSAPRTSASCRPWQPRTWRT